MFRGLLRSCQLPVLRIVPASWFDEASRTLFDLSSNLPRFSSKTIERILEMSDLVASWSFLTDSGESVSEGKTRDEERP